MNPLIRGKFSTRERIIAFNDHVSRTQQHFKDEVNINTILAKYQKTGIVSHVRAAQAKYGDFTQLGEFADHMQTIATAQEAFEALPAKLRNDFGNSPQGFFQFIKDPQNFDACVSYGIFQPKPKLEGTPSTPPVPAAEGQKKAP